ncbi:FYVE zinc finger domain-containing protein [Phytophthora infestans]|uniref:FYVE zinc finger domain-containing protein n=1 Tax=Phytophthora infestans TaxID=4787 RepID=A0A833SSL8_PHYIN|nr:FYVE zinc finger domain-containing protein [Phytophthora infestans]
MANSKQRLAKRSSSAPMPQKLAKQSSSSMSSYNAEGVPLSTGKPEYLELSEDVKDLLVKQISSAVEDVLDSMMHEGTTDAHWRSKMRKDDVEYYEDRESVTKGQSRFCCVSSTDASVEDVISLFLVSDTDTLLQRCRIMYDNLMDARILSVLEHPSEEHPMRSSYVRYTAFKTPALLRNHRDMCVVVATDVIHRPDGSTVGYYVWDSLNLPEVSEFDVPQGFIRSRMFRSGYFVQNSGDPNSETKVAYLVGIEAGGFAPRLATRYVMPRFGAVLNRVVGHLRRKQLDPSTFAAPSEWTDKHKAEFCQCCSKHFGAVKLLDTRRYNCVACGDAICHACHHVEEVEVRGARNTTVGICVGCKTATRKQSRISRWSTRWGSSMSTDTTESSTRSLPI